MSSQDAAFNEDARVQLHNIKLQQALVGLNVRQATAAGSSALGGKLGDLSRNDMNYTQQDAKDIIDRNSADDNAAYMRLAERIVQQQDAAVTSATALRANIPEEGRMLTFKRAVVVDKDADLRIGLDVAPVEIAPWRTRMEILFVAVAVLGVFSWLAKSFLGVGPAFPAGNH